MFLVYLEMIVFVFKFNFIFLSDGFVVDMDVFIVKDVFVFDMVMCFF